MSKTIIATLVASHKNTILFDRISCIFKRISAQLRQTNFEIRNSKVFPLPLISNWFHFFANLLQTPRNGPHHSMQPQFIHYPPKS